MGLFLPSNGSSAYGYGGYGLSSYGGSSTPTQDTFVSGFGKDGTFGGWSAFPAPPIASIGGYGGHYGEGSYGSRGTSVTRVSSARAIDGNTLEIFFSSDVLDDENYYDVDSYQIEVILGAEARVTKVEKGSVGELGVSSVILKPVSYTHLRAHETG